jgi:hypothetical protein
VNESDPNVLSWMRKINDQAVLIILNMSPASQTAQFDLHAVGIAATQAVTVLSSFARSGQTQSLGAIQIPPYGALVANIQ